MSLLLYCLFPSNPEPAIPPNLLGMAGQPIRTVSNGPLLAVFSNQPDKNNPPTLSMLTQYEQVISTCNAIRTVIPLRFGCQFPDENGIRAFLDQHGEPFLKRLQELDGMVEMGIRILIPQNTTDHPPQKQENPQTLDNKNPGHAFLLSRKKHYTQFEQMEEQAEAFKWRCCQAFAGLYREIHREKSHPAKNPLEIPDSIPVHLLVERDKISAVGEAFDSFRQQESSPIFLSGPWAPYNFVSNLG